MWGFHICYDAEDQQEHQSKECINKVKVYDNNLVRNSGGGGLLSSLQVFRQEG